MATWNEKDHPRQPAGKSKGGQFRSTTDYPSYGKDGKLLSKKGVERAQAAMDRHNKAIKNRLRKKYGANGIKDADLPSFIRANRALDNKR